MPSPHDSQSPNSPVSPAPKDRHDYPPALAAGETNQTAPIMQARGASAGSRSVKRSVQDCEHQLYDRPFSRVWTTRLHPRNPLATLRGDDNPRRPCLLKRRTRNGILTIIVGVGERVGGERGERRVVKAWHKLEAPRLQATRQGGQPPWTPY